MIMTKILWTIQVLIETIFFISSIRAYPYKETLEQELRHTEATMYETIMSNCFITFFPLILIFSSLFLKMFFEGFSFLRLGNGNGDKTTSTIQS